MDRISLQAEERAERGRDAVARIRRAGWIPAVLYGKGVEPLSLKVLAKDMGMFLARSEGVHVMMDLSVKKSGLEKGQKWVVMLKEYQIDVISRQFTHIDFCKVDLTEVLEVNVPIHLVGKAEGLQKGGIVEWVTREIAVACLPDKIPGHIEVDITKLDIGDSIHASQISLPQGVTLRPGTDITVVSIAAPREEEVAPAPAAEAVPVEGAPAEKAPVAAKGEAVPTTEAPAKEKGAAKQTAPASAKKEDSKK